MVFLEIELPWNISISPDKLNTKGLLLHKAIILRLLEDIAVRKSSDEHGFYIAVTAITETGEGKIRELTGDVLFPIVFKCLVQKPCKGEILVGAVDKVLKHGIFLKSGPYDSIFLSEKKMGDYKFLAGENPMFVNAKQSRMEKDTSVRFKVLGFRWNEVDRSFQMLASLAADFLGPV